MAQWTPPKAQVISVEAVGSDTVVGLRLPPGLSPPLAPASLLQETEVVIHLDVVLSEDAGVTTFRTEEQPRQPLVGQVLGFQQWWVPGALDAVLDTTRQWTRMRPAQRNHEHCLLGYETIEEGIGDGTGWCSRDDWVCPECFQRFITDDHLRVRGSR